MISGIDRGTARLGMFVLIAAAVSAVAAPRSLAAQEGSELWIEVGDCVELESGEARFECYESRVESARRRGGDGESAAAGRTAASDDGEEREFTGTVAELRERLPNAYRITLDNGQVWRQLRSEWYPLKVGHEVRIYPSRWADSYRLTAEELNGFISVERVR